MILLTLKAEDGFRLGIKTSHGVLDAKAASGALGFKNVVVEPTALFKHGVSALQALRSLVRAAEQNGDHAYLLPDESQLALGPCVPAPGKILCVGLNYLKHAAESGLNPPSTPVLFSKFNNTVAAPFEPVPLPENAEQYDYEAELVVIIGRRARYLAEAEALDYVLGYCNGNDVSARDLQMLTSQWLLGKTLDKFLPLGPYVVTADEAGDPQQMPVRCWLNGELRQDSNTSDMIFSVAQLVAYTSQYITLEPGDIISTGTPEGVILGRQEKNWLKPGDEVSVEIGPLGRLTNRMIKEA